MANRKISELDEATELLTTDILPVVSVATSATKKATFQKILGLVSTNLKPLSNPASSALDMGGFKVTGLADPTQNSDAATKSYVDTQLGTKASTTDLTAKADKTYVDTQLGTKASTADLALKADKTYVDTQLGTKASTTDLTAKADKTYVDTQLGTKASTTDLAAKAALTANTFTGTQTGGDNSLVQWNLKDYGITFLDKGSVSGTSTATFDYTAGSNQKLTITASSATTLAISNWPPSGNLGQLLIELTNGAASGAVIVWPTINWILGDGTVTTSFSSNGVTLQASGTDFILLWTRDGGTTVYGKVVR